MKKTINYEKEILFKTKIGEISTISLEHDFTIDSGYLRGEFLLSGEYKISELSVNKEPFSYKLPLEYELDPKIDIDTLSYDIENFDYVINNDELDINIDFYIKYMEKNNEPIIPDIKEEDLNNECLIPERETPTEYKEKVDVLEEKNINIVKTVSEEDNYIIYHVHIVREGDTLESIASMYNSSVDIIKEYNNTEYIEIKGKLIVPEKCQ